MFQTISASNWAIDSAPIVWAEKPDVCAAVSQLSAWSAALLSALICADESFAVSPAVIAPVCAAVSTAIWAGVKASTCAVDRMAMSAGVSEAICAGVSAAICAGVIAAI